MANPEISRERIAENIEHLVEEIRQCKDNLDEIEACVRNLKDKLREQLEAYGENWSDDEGYARIISEGERTAYDTNALDNLIIEDPLRYGWLKDYRVKSTISSRIQVK